MNERKSSIVNETHRTGKRCQIAKNTISSLEEKKKKKKKGKEIIVGRSKWYSASGIIYLQ